MGRAIVVGKPALNRVTVSIIRDLSQLTAARQRLQSSISTTSQQIILIQNQVNTAQDRVNEARANLDSAIALEEEDVSVVSELNQRYIAELTSLADFSRTLRIAQLRRISFETQLSTIVSEIARDTTRTIATADTGANINIGDEIGIVEYTRLSDPESLYVALPSDSEVRPNRHLYSASRDGIAQPKLASSSYGWWYNTMILPSAQIWRPRYWTAFLVNKDDDDNTGVLFLNKSTDTRLRPFNQNKISYIDVPFEYEDTNSLAFTIGDLVLVEFDIETEEPLIIGFANLERFDTLLYASHRSISAAGSNRINIGVRYPDLTETPGNPIESTYVALNGDDRDFGQEVSLLTSNVQGLINQAEADLIGFSLVNTTNQSSSESNRNLHLRFTSTSFDSTITSLQPESHWPVLTQAGNNITFKEFDYSERRIYEEDDFPGNFFELRANGSTVINLITSQPSNEPLPLSIDLQYDSSYGAQFPRPPRLFQRQEIPGTLLLPPNGSRVLSDEQVFTAFYKLHNLSSGLLVPHDYLFPESFYVQPIEENQFMSVGSMFNKYRGESIPGFGVNTSIGFQISLYTAYVGEIEPPGNVAAVGKTGPQNLLPQSLNLPLTFPPSAVFGTMVQQDIQSPNNLANETYKMISSSTSVQIAEVNIGASSSVRPQLVDGNYTFSVFVRPAVYNGIFIEFGGSTRAQIYADIREGIPYPGTSVPASLQPLDSGIVDIGEGWFRVWLSVAFTGTTPRITLRAYTPNGTDPRGTNGLSVYGPQINTGTVPTPYRETTGVAFP